MSRYDVALTLYREALAINKSALGLTHIEVFDIYEEETESIREGWRDTQQHRVNFEEERAIRRGY